MLFLEDNRILFMRNGKKEELVGFVNPEVIQQIDAALKAVSKSYFAYATNIIRLSDFEHDVLELWSQNRTNYQIAHQLKVKPSQVYKAKTRIKNKSKLLKFDCEVNVNAISVQNRKYYKVKYVADVRIDEMEGENTEDGDLAPIVFTDDGQAEKNNYGQIERENILDMLTDRQKELALLLERGFKPEECAEKMGITVRSIYKMVYAMRERLENVKNT